MRQRDGNGQAVAKASRTGEAQTVLLWFTVAACKTAPQNSCLSLCDTMHIFCLPGAQLGKGYESGHWGPSQCPWKDVERKQGLFLGTR